MADAPDYSSMSEAELDALFAKGDGLVAETAPEPPLTVEPETVPEAEVPADPAAEAPPAEEAAATPEPEAPVKDDAAFDAEGERIKREKLEAALALQQAHSSRLAGEIGFLKEKLKSVPSASEPYEPQSQGELDRLAQLEQRFAEAEQRRTQLEVAQAVDSAINALDSPEVTKMLSAEIAVIAPKYSESLQSARKVSDPELARQVTDAIVRSLLADAKDMRYETQKKAREQEKATRSADLVARKKAATVSGGSASSTARPAAKTYDQMTSAELDAEMEKEFGRR